MKYINSLVFISCALWIFSANAVTPEHIAECGKQVGIDLLNCIKKDPNDRVCKRRAEEKYKRCKKGLGKMGDMGDTIGID